MIDKAIYFAEKLWIFITSLHLLDYVLFFVIYGLLFFITKRFIHKWWPNKTGQNWIAAIFTIFIGLPVSGLIMFFLMTLWLNSLSNGY
jgi:hypothetical protein